MIGLYGCVGPATTLKSGETDEFYSSSSRVSDSDKLVAEVVAKELRVPWAMAFAPDGRLFVTERNGTLRVVEDGVLKQAPYAQLDVIQEGESGLLGIDLDPDFELNGHIYMYQTYSNHNGGLSNKVVRWEDNGEGLVEPLVILDGIPGGRIHNGGRIKFGPDGKLYITTGDASNDTLAQDIDSLAGKILRLNKDGSIPSDNPFINSPVYTYGHRNPQGMAWHPTTGELYSTEHGPVGHDEINLIVAGGNYGWPIVLGEGNQEGTYTPVAQSGIETWAPSGAIFYDGNIMPSEWKDRLIFGCLRGQRIFWVSFGIVNNSVPQKTGSLFEHQLGRIRDVIQGPDEYIYFITSNRDGRGNPGLSDDLLLRVVPISGSLGVVPRTE